MARGCVVLFCILTALVGTLATESLSCYDQIEAVSRSGDRDVCRLPFEYKDVTYYGCTTARYHEPWCRTGHDDREWGVCTIETIGGPGGGARCEFPFTFDGTAYHNCTMADSGGETYDVPWCATTDFVDDDHLWGACLLGAGTRGTPGSRIMAVGNSDGEEYACQFPFTHDDKEYSWCTTKDHDTPWCRLENGDWGNCIIKTTDGDNCVFPFTYEGVTYTHCTMDDYHLPWCSTTAQFEGNGQWGVCVLYEGCESPE